MFGKFKRNSFGSFMVDCLWIDILRFSVEKNAQEAYKVAVEKGDYEVVFSDPN